MACQAIGSNVRIIHHRVGLYPISHQRMDVRIGDPAVRALQIGTGETLRVYAFGSSSPAFDLAPGPHRQRR